MVKPNRFEAVMLDPSEGWLVLSPWIKTPCGKAYRHHIWSRIGAQDDESRKWAEHLAAELNRVAGYDT